MVYTDVRIVGLQLAACPRKCWHWPLARHCWQPYRDHAGCCQRWVHLYTTTSNQDTRGKLIIDAHFSSQSSLKNTVCWLSHYITLIFILCCYHQETTRRWPGDGGGPRRGWDTMQQCSDCSKVRTHYTMFTLGGCSLQLCSHLRIPVQKMNGLPQLSSCLDPLRQVFAAKHQCCRLTPLWTLWWRRLSLYSFSLSVNIS